MSRPIPRPTAETQAFWEGCAEGVVRYQCCQHCGQVQLIPRARCVSCHHDALEWKRSAGRGQILTYTVVHRAPTPAFRGEVPYVIAIVDMEEGFRLMVNVKDGNDDLAIGQPVRITFREVEGATLPQAEVSA